MILFCATIAIATISMFYEPLVMMTSILLVPLEIFFDLYVSKYLRFRANNNDLVNKKLRSF